ncbi:OsmC family peroxiredoxin [Aliihoeflea aestuarii]|jgi:organic hydroperoxide reductase OsmC/OhrA|uniref:OsmC family protein n=1 Tax=Aliihoeflea aestuarii TaxID=453840 RepID=UPI002093E2AB|nr:OsmC family protein [Aliihoeflea aestuarii]MCO6389858.1 OsmC family peroxiredoxin [Aliihoeflea aestuarii]
MSKHIADVTWTARAEDDFLAGRYSRAHTIRFDGGAEIPGSPSPGVVPAPWSDGAAVDPEEMFVASLSACHMLWFLDFARRAGVTIYSYRDQAEGLMGKNDKGRIAITHVTLRPIVDSDAEAATLDELHHKAHEACFIANSVTTEVTIDTDSENQRRNR